MPLFSQRRCEDVLGPLEARHIEVVERKIEVLWAGFRVDRQAPIACLANLFERFVAGEMHDVDGRAGHFRERYRSRHRFRFGSRRTRERVIFRSALAFRQSALDDHVYRSAVFRVHADQPAIFRGLRHRPKNRRVVQHENARISHEQLEAAHAFANEFAHFLELRIAQIGDDAMERIVHHGFAFGFLHPGFERLPQRLSLVLDREIHKRGRAAMGRGDSARFEIVGAGGSAKGHVEVGVDVNAAG